MQNNRTFLEYGMTKEKYLVNGKSEALKHFKSSEMSWKYY